MDDAAPLDPLTEALQDVDDDARACGRCLVWHPTLKDDRGRWVGPCRLRPDRGDFPATAPICDRFLARGSKVPAAPPSAPRAHRPRSVAPRIRHAADPAPRPDIDLGELTDMTRQELVEILRDALEDGPVPDLAGKWEGGTIVMKPGNDTQPKEIPLDVFFKKVVRVRDQLRVLEQKVNAHKTLTEAEKVELEGYITRCYGSLTSFNVLFRDEVDRFRGSGG